MNHKHFAFCISVMLMLLLAACVPSSTAPTAVVIVMTVPATPVVTAIVNSVSGSTSGTVPVNLAGSPMQVGSKYLNFDGASLVAVPGGPFTMGYVGSDNPVHTVTLSNFWIYSTKVTNREYQQCVAVGKCTPPDSQDDQGYTDFDSQSDPIVGVTWAQSEAYCEYANGQLPTEAQWEKAARGPNGNIYPWGNSSPSVDLLNYNNNIRQTTNVINYPLGKSYYGALDMEGNTYEWVHDWYDPFYYRSGPAQDPLGPATGSWRSVRSAGYKSNNDQVKASTRDYRFPAYHARDLGFRCVVKAPTFLAPMCSLTALAGPNVTGNSVPSAAGRTCPLVGVSVTYSGCGTSPIASVNFTDNEPGGSDPNASIVVGTGCSQPSPLGPTFPKVSTCTNIPGSGVDVSITSQCTYYDLLQAICPPHYNLAGNHQCVWDGSDTAGQSCPAGTQYDAAHSCCTTTATTATNFPACPAGMFFQNMGGNVYECLPGGLAGTVTPASAHVQPSNLCSGIVNNP